MNQHDLTFDEIDVIVSVADDLAHVGDTKQLAYLQQYFKYRKRAVQLRRGGCVDAALVQERYADNLIIVLKGE